MSDSAPALRDEHEPLADSDYDTILAAVMETARGRWFLHEYARRNRNADTGTVLAAIGRIEWLLQSREAAAPIADAPAALPGILVRLRDIAENLIECGAPTYLCNELLQRIGELAQAGPAQNPTPAEAEPAAIADAAAIVAAEPPRDPFADILALSPEEKIALFT
jgi:hypothetical protein